MAHFNIKWAFMENEKEKVKYLHNIVKLWKIM